MINFSLEEDQQVRFTDKIVKVYIINKFKITKTSTNTKRSFHNITTQTICPTYAKQNKKLHDYQPFNQVDNLSIDCLFLENRSFSKKKYRVLKLIIIYLEIIFVSLLQIRFSIRISLKVSFNIYKEKKNQITI